MSDRNETNNPAPIAEDEVHEPLIQVLKGQPTDEELAALIAVFGNLSNSATEIKPRERNKWGLPVDRLRFSTSDYQRLTLQQQERMR